MPDAEAESLLTLYDVLFSAYGPQNWWPAETPFEVMIGAILTQNTAWTNVERAIAAMKAANLLDAARIVEADAALLAETIRPAGYFNVKARRLRHFCRFWLREGGLEGLRNRPTERLRQQLLAVHGVGPETADDMLLYGFERPVFVIDAYTRRIGSRLGLLDGDAPYESLRKQFEEALPKDVELFGEYHALLVRHAKQACRTAPRCDACAMREACPNQAVLT